MIFGIANKDKTLEFGYQLVEGQKPALVVRDGNKTYYLAFFQNEEQADFFIKKVLETLGVTE